MSAAADYRATGSTPTSLTLDRGRPFCWPICAFRGVPYGPVYDPTKPDKLERGLLGNFIGASLGAQFEAMSYEWINVGLHDPRVTGSSDPLVGANDHQTSWFDLPLKSGGSIKLRGLPRFVETRGGAYTFLPSLPSIRFLAAMTN